MSKKQIIELISLRNIYRYTNVDLKICQYLRLHMKIICRRFHINTLKHLLHFEICPREVRYVKSFVYKHSETKEKDKN